MPERPHGSRQDEVEQSLVERESRTALIGRDHGLPRDTDLGSAMPDPNIDYKAIDEAQRRAHGLPRDTDLGSAMPDPNTSTTE
jgi:hypothetical protein